MKLYLISSGISLVLLAVLAIGYGIATSNWLRLWALAGGLALAVILAVYSTIRRRGRVEATATQLKFTDGFGREQSVPIAEVSSLIRCTIEMGRRKLPSLAVLVIDKAGHVRLRFSHYIDVERLGDTIGVPVTGRFEDRAFTP